jgi:hypothetical protein
MAHTFIAFYVAVGHRWFDRECEVCPARRCSDAIVQSIQLRSSVRTRLESFSAFFDDHLPLNRVTGRNVVTLDWQIPHHCSLLSALCSLLSVFISRSFHIQHNITRRQPMPPRTRRSLDRNRSPASWTVKPRTTASSRHAQERFHWLSGQAISLRRRTLDCRAGHREFSGRLASPIINAGGMFRPTDSEKDIHFFWILV